MGTDGRERAGDWNIWSCRVAHGKSRKRRSGLEWTAEDRIGGEVQRMEQKWRGRQCSCQVPEFRREPLFVESFPFKEKNAGWEEGASSQSHRPKHSRAE